MPDVNVRMDIVDMFFDRQKVLDAVGKENARKLSKAGAFIRQRAKTSLRRRKRPAAAGEPPSVHSRSSRTTLRNILFGLNPDWESVVIGPVGIGAKRLRGSSAATVPELMEFGGMATLEKERARYSKHPFMKPALDKEIASGSIAGMWAARA